jgi:hypothetical protein
MTANSYTPPELARRYRVTADKVLGWIRSGQLSAVNVAQRPDGRPRWRISQEAIEAFERARSARPAPVVRRVKRKRLAGIKEYF